jgi:hypothetical protein
MIEAHRFWYEAECTLWGGDALQQTVDEFISKIDGVGYNNQGPWVPSAIPEPKVVNGSETEWYW